MPSSSLPPPSAGARRTNAALFVVFLAFGTVFVGYGVSVAREQRHILAHSFPVPATVVGLDIETHWANGRGGTTYRPVVRFEYQIGGTTRMGDGRGVKEPPTPWIHSRARPKDGIAPDAGSAALDSGSPPAGAAR